MHNAQCSPIDQINMLRREYARFDRVRISYPNVNDRRGTPASGNRLPRSFRELRTDEGTKHRPPLGVECSVVEISCRNLLIGLAIYKSETERSEYVRCD